MTTHYFILLLIISLLLSSCGQPSTPTVHQQPAITEQLDQKLVLLGGDKKSFETNPTFPRSTPQTFNKPVIDPFQFDFDKPEESAQEQLQNALNNQDYKSATKILKAKLLESPDDGKTLYQLGMCYFQQQDYARSLPYVKRSLSITPRFVLARRLHGILMLNKKQYHAAIEDFEFVSTQQVDDSQVLIWKAIAHLNLREHAEALACVEQGLPLPNSDLAELYYLRSVSTLRMGNIKQAQADLLLAEKHGCASGKIAQVADEIRRQPSP